jgi:hypothetical protein
LRILAQTPSNMGVSYPANAGWRLWALAKGGRADVVVKELRERWALLDSVRLNNALQENWHVKPDSDSQWSHCPGPALCGDYEPGGNCRSSQASNGLKSSPTGGLEELEFTAYRPQGPIEFNVKGKKSDRTWRACLPKVRVNFSCPKTKLCHSPCCQGRPPAVIPDTGCLQEKRLHFN